MKGKLTFVPAILLLAVLTGCTDGSTVAGEHRIERTQNRIDSAAHSGHSASTSTTVFPSAYDNSGGEPLDESLSEDTNYTADSPFGRLLGETFEFVFFYTRYADYPNEDGRSARFVYPPLRRYCVTNDEESFLRSTKALSLRVDVSGSYLYLDTFGAGAKCAVDISGFHLDAGYENIFAGTEGFALFDFDAGLSVAFSDVLITGFLGVSLNTLTSGTFFNRGIEVQAFLPRRLLFDACYLRCSLENAVIDRAVLSLGLSAGRLGIFAGAAYENYSGITYLGPIIKISVWL